VIEIILFPTIFLLSYFAVEAFRLWSLRRKLLDVPNERSSHSDPTPVGGGLVIVLIGLIAYSIHTIFFGGGFFWGYVLGAALVAGVSWLDDLYGVSSLWRFLIHSLAALLVIYNVGYFEEFYIPLVQMIQQSRFPGILFTFFWIVWLTNLYNFMDGIDGIAGMQTVTAGIGWMVAGKLLGADSIEFYAGILTFSGLGFLIQNWQPARIFMGDVGSAFLGFTHAALPLLAGQDAAMTPEKRPVLLLLAAAFNWLFVFDTVYTFIRRIVEGEKFWQAHRSHLYQKLVIAGFSHQFVALLYGGISILTIIITVFVMLRENIGEVFLIAVIGVQSLGLLFFAYLFGGKKQ
jgi:UDP-N-acetylmuramyl pentapeptide phosphotransferase/UDP-N-acetylglucosamine-1-phosphate transferase